MNGQNLIFQFQVTLEGINPIIWRRIQVPAKYSFWDLHVAIQDSMGWFDCHLHAFRLKKPHGKKIVEIGIPTDDFGDGWNHEILLEGILLKEKGIKYPTCTGGQRACPPEDCGGIWGYENLLEILRDPNHEEYESMTEWLSGWYGKYDPEAFDPKKIKFDNPKTRWTKAFSAR